MNKPMPICQLINKALRLLLIVFLLFAVPMPLMAAVSSTSVYKKAIHLYEKQRWQQAKEYFHQYVADYSDTPLYITCLYYLAYCYQQLKENEQAIIIYHKVIDQAKEDSAFWSQMSQRRIEELN